jgi:hypothetical protein
MVIVWGDGRWEPVTMVEERNGSIIYQKKGSSPRAAMEDSVDKRTTRELNEALRDFASACGGASVDLSGMFQLEGRSQRLFHSIANRQSSDCFQRLRQEHQARLRAAEQGVMEKRLSDVASGVSIEGSGESQDLVISNLDTTTTARGALTQGGQSLGGAYNHQAEYTLRAEEVIKKECWDDWAGDSSMYRSCVEDESEALERLKGRTVTQMPLDVFNLIRDECREDWPLDYSMRNHCEVEEIRSYWAIERRMEDADFSQETLRTLRQRCAQDWPRDFGMREHCLKEAMERLRPAP